MPRSSDFSDCERSLVARKLATNGADGEMAMIIVEGWVRLAPGEAERVRPAALSMAEETRREPGCLAYAFAQDLRDPDMVWVVERWKDEDSLAAHFVTPHMAAFNAAMASAKIVGADVSAYRAEFVRTVMSV